MHKVISKSSGEPELSKTSSQIALYRAFAQTFSTAHQDSFLVEMYEVRISMHTDRQLIEAVQISSKLNITVARTSDSSVMISMLVDVGSNHRGSHSRVDAHSL